MNPIPAFVRGTWVSWTPRPGLDPTVSQRMKLVGAMVYAHARTSGKSEEEAHEEAERSLYESVYGCSYSRE